MKRIGTVIAIAALATAGTAFAGQEVKQAKPQAVKMTDAQLDKVAAGLITVVAVDVVDVNNNSILNNNDVQLLIPVNASVAIGILGNAGAVAAQRPGRNIINN